MLSAPRSGSLKRPENSTRYVASRRCASTTAVWRRQRPGSLCESPRFLSSSPHRGSEAPVQKTTSTTLQMLGRRPRRQRRRDRRSQLPFPQLSQTSMRRTSRRHFLEFSQGWGDLHGFDEAASLGAAGSRDSSGSPQQGLKVEGTGLGRRTPIEEGTTSTLLHHFLPLCCLFSIQLNRSRGLLLVRFLHRLHRRLLRHHRHPWFVNSTVLTCWHRGKVVSLTSSTSNRATSTWAKACRQRRLPGSRWSNPFKVAQHGREGAIERYRKMDLRTGRFPRENPPLEGKRLMCAVANFTSGATLKPTSRCS